MSAVHVSASIVIRRPLADVWSLAADLEQDARWRAEVHSRRHLTPPPIATRADLLSFLRLVTITNALHVVAADPDDDKVVECAVVSGATHIVTGDRRHLLPLGHYGAIGIITTAQLIALVPLPDDQDQ